jgi:hypothetical protein
MKSAVLIAWLAAAAMAQTGTTKAAPVVRTPANLAQLMRGIIYPSSNVIFAAQTQNPADTKPAADPAMSPNLLTSAYGKWDAVENSSLALAEAASLLSVAGRKCSNGADVPLKSPDWAKLVQALREAGITGYKAAQTKNQEKIVDAANDITTACENCHEKYREKPNLLERCK